MMVKKIILILTIVFIISASVVPASAAGLELVNDGENVIQTDEFLVTITRPEGPETTYNTSYIICGISKEKDIRISLLMYNETTKSYEPFANTEGQSSWEIGNSGIFMKEVQLKKGANKIRIAAYKAAEVENLKLNENLQVCDFIVTVLDESGIKEIIKDGLQKISDLFGWSS